MCTDTMLTTIPFFSLLNCCIIVRYFIDKLNWFFFAFTFQDTHKHKWAIHKCAIVSLSVAFELVGADSMIKLFLFFSNNFRPFSKSKEKLPVFKF